MKLNICLIAIIAALLGSCCTEPCGVLECPENRTCIDGVCKCKEGLIEPDCTLPESANCEKICQNNSNLNAETCQCDCVDNFVGDLCQYDTFPCPEFECVNGDLEKSESTCTCKCIAGWQGVSCNEEIPPEPPQPLNKQIRPDDSKFKGVCPNRKGNGDREFAGNGPRVQIRLELRILQEKYIEADLWFNVKETRSDWTEGEIYMNGIVVYEASVNERIVGFSERQATIEEIDWIDDDITYDYIEPDPIKIIGGPNEGIYNTIAEHYGVMGDTGNEDVGNCNSGKDALLDVTFGLINILVFYE